MSIWRNDTPLILASGSATRRLMLEEIGLPIDVHVASVDERAIDAPLRAKGAAPSTITTALARAKAQAVSRLHPGRLVLGADQILDCDGVIFDKAPDREAALSHLAHFAGRAHRLTSAAALVRDGDVVFETHSEAHLIMRPLDSTAIAAYADVAGPVLTRSVGAYEIEGLGAYLFARIVGDHFTIRGLPLLDLLAGLRQNGFLAW